VTPEKAKILKNSGLDQLTVSLDGTTPDINDKNRGMGSFDKAIQGINNARNTGLGVTIAYTVNPYNICDTKNIFPFAQTYGL
jgi:sulfatase maturation enzyme AslB (radical SAM superfamily)